MANILFKPQSPKKYSSEPSDVTYMSKLILQSYWPAFPTPALLLSQARKFRDLEATREHSAAMRTTLPLIQARADQQKHAYAFLE